MTANEILNARIENSELALKNIDARITRLNFERKLVEDRLKLLRDQLPKESFDL